MAEGSFSNRSRAYDALTIYRDAMGEYIASILEREHGQDWARSQLLAEELERRNRGEYERRRLALNAGKDAQGLIDLPDIPRLIEADRESFPALRSKDDFAAVEMIRRLRNELVHSGEPGDCTSDMASTIASLCTSILTRCSQHEAAEKVRRLARSAAGDELAATDVDSPLQGECEHLE